MKKGFGLVAIVVLSILVACGAPAKEQIHTDAIDIIDVDMKDRGVAGLSWPTEDMSEIEDLGDGLYKVSGMVGDEDGYGNEFWVKLRYDRGDIVDYEWYVLP